MKKTFILTVIMVALFAFHGRSQSIGDHALPAIIATQFNKEHPGTKIKKWRYSDHTYAVKYRDGNKNRVVYFSQDGHWQKDETKYCLIQSLPQPVKKGLRANGFASYYYEKIEEVDSVGNHYFTFLADTYPPSPEEDSFFFKQYLLCFTPQGWLIKKTLLPFD